MAATTHPTVRSIAQALGLSRTTVSEALRNNPRVNLQTRERVQEAALAAGYRYNPLASSIMSEVRRTGLSTFRGALAAVNFIEPARPFFPGPYLRDLLRGAGERAAQLGFILENLNIPRRGRYLERLDSILHARGIRGVLFCPAWIHPDFSRLSWKNYAGVYADYLIARPAVNSVCPDHHFAMTSVMVRLHELGYRRPGLVLQEHHSERVQHRWVAAFLAYSAFHHGEIETVPPLVRPEITREDFVRWFKEEKPDVVLAHRAEMVTWMRECGARVPETHGFCCLNVSLNTTPCAGIDLQPYQIGVRSIEVVIADIHRNEYGLPEIPCNTTVPCRLVDGPTLPSSAGIANPPRRDARSPQEFPIG